MVSEIHTNVLHCGWIQYAECAFKWACGILCDFANFHNRGKNSDMFVIFEEQFIFAQLLPSVALEHHTKPLQQNCKFFEFSENFLKILVN